MQHRCTSVWRKFFIRFQFNNIVCLYWICVSFTPERILRQEFVTSIWTFLLTVTSHIYIYIHIIIKKHNNVINEKYIIIIIINVFICIIHRWCNSSQQNSWAFQEETTVFHSMIICGPFSENSLYRIYTLASVEAVWLIFIVIVRSYCSLSSLSCAIYKWYTFRPILL